MGGLSFTLGWPAALWGLLLCPLMLLAVIGSRAVLSKPMLVVVTTMRLAVVALIVLAVGAARVHWPSDDLAVAVVVDGSASVATAERDALIKRARWLARTKTDVTWIDLTPTAEERDRGDDRGDLAARVAAAQALLPRDHVRRVVVATDGRDDDARLRPAVRAAAADGVQVFFVPAGERPPVDEAAVVGLEVPRLIRAGETANVRVSLQCREAQQVSLRLELDRQVVATLQVAAPAGRSSHVHQITFRDEGIHELVARLEAPRNRLVENDVWTSLLRVAPPPRVLLIREQEHPEPALAKVLRDARLQVEVMTPAKVARSRAGLNRYQLVVTDELDPARLGDAQQRAIREWVEDGGGLVTVTGVNAVRREPATFREIEPVIPPRAIPETPPMEIVLVIDRSGSMSGYRLDMARQAGIAAVQAMRADSRVGLVAFSGSPDTVIAPVEMSRSQWLIAMIATLSAGGGTDIAAALNAAGSIMTNDPRYLHHIILLSDGVSSTQPAIWEAQMLATRGITISTISLGNRNSLMSDVAAIGRGRYHVANDPSQLPQLFVREARYRQAPPHKVGDFRPDVAEPMGFLDGVDFTTDPPIGGYVLAEARPEARVVLRSPDGDPILAHWSVGSGQVASFVSTTSGGWSDRWRAGASFARLWSQMAWELLRERVEGEVEMRVDPHPRTPELQVITVATHDVEAETPPVVDLARGTDPRAIKPLELTPRGPGLWQVEVDRGTGFVSSAAPRDGEDPVAAVAVDHPFSGELAELGPDRTSLERLAEDGGGRVIDTLDLVTAPGGDVTTTRPLRLPLLVLALILYLASVLLLRLPQNAKAATKGAATRRSRGGGSRSPTKTIASTAGRRA